MTIATDEERKELLLSYINLEPQITINGFCYELSACLDDRGVIFYCVNIKNHSLGATVICPRPTWETCNSGLSLAYLYNVVLEVCEQAILKHDGTPIHYIRGCDDNQSEFLET